jgi:H+/gluconate symporter-like permease
VSFFFFFFFIILTILQKKKKKKKKKPKTPKKPKKQTKKTKKKAMLSLFLLFLSLIKICESAHFKWTGQNDNNFHNNFNWDLVGIPGPGDTAEVAVAIAVEIIADSALIDVDCITVGTLFQNATQSLRIKYQGMHRLNTGANCELVSGFF